jgi:putative transcriptional regulator
MSDPVIEQAGGVEFEVRNRLRELRTAHGLTQEELAELVSVTRQTIGLIENHRYNPTLSLCLRLAVVLDTELGELFWAEVQQ